MPGCATVAVHPLGHLIDEAFALGALVRKVFGSGRLAFNQRPLARIGRVTVAALLVAMEQVWKGMFVVHGGRRDHGAVRQPRLAIHPDVQLESPLLALPGLAHLWISRLVCVLGPARCADDAGVHDGAGVDLEASGLQFLPHLGKQGLAELLVIEQSAKLSCPLPAYQSN